MLLSIVLTAFNSSDTILKCMESILESKSDRFELIVVDDCSEKSCASIIQDCRDQRVKYIYNKVNLGPGLSRNVGLDNARGDFITFVDADDWYERGAVDRILEVLLEKEFDLLVFDFSTVYSSGIVKKQWIPSGQWVMKDFLCDRLISTAWNKVYRVDLINKSKIRFPSYLSEDSVFNMKYLLRCESVDKLDEFLYFFDKSGESITRSRYTMKSYAHARQALDDMENALESESLEVRTQFRKYLRTRRFLFLFKDPVLRIYRDWLNGNIDQTVLAEFRDSGEFRIKDLFYLYASRLITAKDWVAFLLFKVSPSLVFHLMKISKTA